MLLVLLAFVCAWPAAAREPLAARCMAYGLADESVARFLAGPIEWDCSPPPADIAHDRIALRFDIDKGAGAPEWLMARRNPLQRLTIAAIDSDGTMRSASHGFDDVRPANASHFFQVPLPAITPDTQSLVAVFDLPTQSSTIDLARIGATDPLAAENHTRGLLLLAMLCGMMVMPLVFNLAFYRVLRQRFVLWHMALTTALLVQILLASSIWSHFLPLRPIHVSSGIVFSFGASVAAALMFARSYVEPGRLDPRLYRLLPWMAGWCMVVSLLYGLFPFALRAHSSTLFYCSFVPVFATFLAVMADAWMRGSRAIRFQIVGWAPFVLVGAIRLISHLVPGLPQNDAVELFQFGALVEVIATALGVADRFMILKRARDRAETRARTMKTMSERDALTGLFNRRGIEPRFAELQAQGFHTFALLDIDHFKAINDTHGHARGDQVLVAVAKALGTDEDALVMRLGGEEFMLLLRGEDAAEQAERRRQAIPARVAADVAGLGAPVTASMGLIEYPPQQALGAGFDDICAHCDKLLYEAKANGRNRTQLARVRSFASPGRKPQPNLQVA